MTTANITFETLSTSITALQASEKISKQLLSELSRNILHYVYMEGDIRPVNALLGANDNGYVLSPVNWRIACQYFHHFLGFKSNFNDVRKCIVEGGKREPLVFSGKNKQKFDDKQKLIHAWLSSEDNDIWAWSHNVKVEAKPVDFKARLISAINSAIDDEKGGLTAKDVFDALAESDIDTDTLLLAAMASMEGNDIAEAA